ncbi:MAG: hypothetical protein UW68_C0045G0004 [Candidatus Collierbacteria bacterium GW2011_GWB1_44_6]|uniref:Uncharacterized protein n=1 Tax=Candidatus Collierbacteria bacterium GW2011_GWB1_44_6 TaxID=1618384 RepID=A0A0G1JLC7_9BACT|nr:MAG: hypothetical protein UW68_C0045G0004 [Candidatus Collierbacteria bacterium GW2011_GWB1_44_6]
MNIVKVLLLKADTLHNSYTSAPGEDLGRFRLRGANNTSTNLNHQIVLTDIADDHVLMWDALNLSGEPVKVVLTLTSLPHRHGLRLHYTLLKS